MKRLTYYKVSKINHLHINYGGEKIRINLWRELRITPESIDAELKNQPSSYGFLLMLHKRLLADFEEAKLERGRVYGKLFLSSKGKTGANNRLFSEEACKAYAESHPHFIEASQKCIMIRKQADEVYSAVRAFEQRKDLMQTISSNQRKEKF